MSLTCNDSKWNGTKPAGFNPDNYCSRLPYYTPELIDIREGFKNSIDPMMQAQMGICGTVQYLAAAATSTAGKYYCMIQVIEDTVLNVAAAQTDEIDGLGASVDLTALIAVVLPKGLILYGNFKKVVTVTGLIKLYPHPFL